LENEAFASAEVVAPTVQTVGSEAGETFAAFWFSFPAATARKILLSMRPLAALLRDAE
jgi:hypothetical protein